MRKILCFLFGVLIFIGYAWCGSQGSWSPNYPHTVYESKVTYTTNVNVGIGGLKRPNDDIESSIDRSLLVAEFSADIAYDFTNHWMVGISPSYNVSVGMKANDELESFSLLGEIGWYSVIDQDFSVAVMGLVGYNFGLKGIDFGFSLRNFFGSSHGYDVLRLVFTYLPSSKALRVCFTGNLFVTWALI